MSNKDRSKQDISNQKRQDHTHAADQGNARQRDNNRANAGLGDDYRSTNLQDSPMMAHLIGAMQKGEDVGHYGQLVFVMVARFFLSEDEMLKLLEKQPGLNEMDARKLIMQVKERDYNPPKRERILQWQSQQDFQICPEPDEPNACNVYRELKFPDDIYENIDDFWEEKAEAEKDHEE